MAANAAPPAATPTVTPHWVTGLAAGSGSTVGPDGALYVPEPASGTIFRVDPDTGTRTSFGRCLPPWVIPLGGAMDVAFIGNTLYALVTIVSDPFPPIGVHPVVDGIYRVDGPDSCSVVADIGAFAVAHTPNANIFLVTGVQYAMEPYRGGFLVTDGHHNRVYRVTLDGKVSEFISFGNVVPTGLQVQGNTIYMAEAGPPLTTPRTARSSHSARARPQQRSSPLAPGSSSTWNAAAARRSSASRRGIPTSAIPTWAATAGHPPTTPDGSLASTERRVLTPVAGTEARPANLARNHRHDRIRGHTRRRNLEDRQHLRAALRALIPLRPSCTLQGGSSRPAASSPHGRSNRGRKAAHEKGLAMTIITPIRIATVLGTAALLAGALATTATAEPGNPPTESNDRSAELDRAATDERPPDISDAAILSSSPQRSQPTRRP